MVRTVIPCARERLRRVPVVLVGAMSLATAVLAAVPAAGQQHTPTTRGDAQNGPRVFDGVTVIDVQHGTLVPNQRVVIADRHIQAVGAASAVALPEGAEVVDARGKFLIPGLWDMHTHPQARTDFFYPLFIANGVTGIRNAWSQVPLKTQVQQWHEILAGTRVGPPRQLLAGLSFGQHYPDTDSVTVQRIVDSLKADGANFLKVYPYSRIVAVAARRAGLPFGGHLVYLSFGGISEAPESAVEASESGMRIFDHSEYAPKLLGLCWHGGASVERCRPIAEQFRRNGSWWCPTLTLEVVGNESPYTERAKALVDGAPAHGNWLHDVVVAPDTAPGLLSIAQTVGMPILAGTDDQTAPGFTLHSELALLVAEGLTPLAALQSATLNPAVLLGATDSLGTVAPGRLADVVLLDANPLQEITTPTASRAVMANGRYYDRAALDALLADARNAGGGP